MHLAFRRVENPPWRSKHEQRIRLDCPTATTCDEEDHERARTWTTNVGSCPTKCALFLRQSGAFQRRPQDPAKQRRSTRQRTTRSRRQRDMPVRLGRSLYLGCGQHWNGIEAGFGSRLAIRFVTTRTPAGFKHGRAHVPALNFPHGSPLVVLCSVYCPVHLFGPRQGESHRKTSLVWSQRCAHLGKNDRVEWRSWCVREIN